nr:4Fe-4S binding protein [Methanococcus voltae]
MGEDIVKVNNLKCGYCGACVGICPRNAIELIENKIEINDEKCKGCKLCKEICPVNALEE